MTAQEAIAFLQKLPPDTPLIKFVGDSYRDVKFIGASYRDAKFRAIEVYKSVSGGYGKFWSEGQQHCNNAKAIAVE